jgi:Cdc6-like AAA superfamily ATPase
MILTRSTSSVHEAVQDLQSQANHVISEKNSDALHAWLSPPDVSKNYTRALQERHEGTGQWFPATKVYESWKETPKSLLWLNGKPGSGKTILSATIIENLQSTGPDSPALLYFYFDFSDFSKQTLESMIRALIYQLHCQISHVQGTLQSLYEGSCYNGRSQPQLSSLLSTFESMLLSAGNVRIVLDALDECSTRSDLLNWIMQLLDTCPRTSLLTTSRPEQEIDSAIRDLTPPENIIPLHSKLVHPDICNFIESKIHTDPALSRWSNHPKVQEEIKATLKDKADGM